MTADHEVSVSSKGQKSGGNGGTDVQRTGRKNKRGGGWPQRLLSMDERLTFPSSADIARPLEFAFFDADVKHL